MVYACVPWLDPFDTDLTHPCILSEYSDKSDRVVALNPEDTSAVALPHRYLATAVSFANALHCSVDLAAVLTVPVESIFRILWRRAGIEFTFVLIVSTAYTPLHGNAER